MTTHTTREAWLIAAIDALAAHVFTPADIPLPAVRVSVGWPGGRGKKNAVIGQCWSAGCADDGVAQVFISPALDDAVRVLDVLAHELIHAVDDNASGHKGAFVQMARTIGLEGKPTATVAGEALKATLGTLADALGPYPHAALTNPEGAKKQGARMLKVACTAGNGYIVRMTRKWLDEYGAPTCPCHGERMEEAA